MQTLDLNLDEIVHIRSVLTKAELEGLPLDGNLKEDVEKGKVCFLCMKTRFGFFNRGCKCELCTRQVCSKCTTKVIHKLCRRCCLGLKIRIIIKMADLKKLSFSTPPILNFFRENFRDWSLG